MPGGFVFKLLVCGCAALCVAFAILVDYVNSLETLAVTGFAFLVGLVSLRLPGWWRSDKRVYRVTEGRSETALSFGRSVARGFVRGWPAIMVGSWFLAVGGVLAVVVRVRGAPVLTLAAGGFGLCLALHVAVILFNRPKWIVPPAMRHEPGTIAVWSGRQKNTGK